MFKPLKAGLEVFLEGFYDGLNADTKPLEEFVDRGFGKCFAHAPSRMVDAAEEMLDSWQRNDTDPAPTPLYKLPVAIVAIARDYIPTGRDFSRQLASSEYVVLPGDEKGRIFGLRTSVADIRAQVAFFASDVWTARSLVAQLLTFLDIPANRRYLADYTFAGLTLPWPVAIETPEIAAQSIASESKNVAILVVDMTLKATVPMFDAPKDDEPNDGRGTDGDPDDPHGYPSVQEVENNWHEPVEPGSERT